jgi:hypothetical protein
MQGLNEHTLGAGIAASVILKALMDELVSKGIHAAANVTRVLNNSDSILANVEQRTAILDARKVVQKIRGNEV